MSNRVYVGNLQFHTTESLINQTFAACGEVAEVDLVLDRVSGRSRGFAFVQMATAEGMQRALELDGTDLEGRPLRVNVAEERRGPSGGPRRGGRR